MTLVQYEAISTQCHHSFTYNTKEKLSIVFLVYEFSSKSSFQKLKKLLQLSWKIRTWMSKIKEGVFQKKLNHLKVYCFVIFQQAPLDLNTGDSVDQIRLVRYMMERDYWSLRDN